MNKYTTELKCTAQEYNWGNFGLTSTVAKLLSGGACSNKIQIDEKTPYAELWMGSHPSAPSRVLVGDNTFITLKEYVDRNGGAEQLYGKKVVDRFGKDFPFLFKVLSIRTALSIQSHPDSVLAKQLHSNFPDIYKDPYHKPEIAIALTPFKALCSFRNLKEIHQFVENVPELKDTISSKIDCNTLNTLSCNDYLRSIVTNLLQAKSEVVSNNLEKLYNRLSKQQEKSTLDQLVMTLYEQYVGDVGVFFAYLLNYIEMNPGDALFLPAGEPHAYVAGDCVECMAPSDNVVRAGLTPKLKDVDTLATMLTYTTGCPEFVNPIISSGNGWNAKVFQPPVDEFEVEELQLTEIGSTYTSNLESPSILLLLQGSIKMSDFKNNQPLIKGSVLFIPTNTSFKLESLENNTIIYIARVNSRLFQ